MPEAASAGAPILADTITRLGPEAAGNVVVTGSHGGVYAAYVAARASCRAVIFNNAGVGLEAAGISGLDWLEGLGMAAAAVDHMSARIGDAADMMARGSISHANRLAQALGVQPGQPCAEAARLLAAAPVIQGMPPEVLEARRVLASEGARRRLVLVDSAGLVRPEDAGQVVVTGSHGGLFGSDPMNALKVDAYLAVFNDAGGGPDDVGMSRLPALDARGIAAVTVSAATARIGQAESSWRDGVISAANATAARLGARPGLPACAVIDSLLRAEA